MIRLAVCSAVLVMSVSEARAGGSTASIGARGLDGGGSVVGEYWVGRVGFSLDAGFSLVRSERTSELPDGTTQTSTRELDRWHAGGGVFYAVARGERAQLSVGARVAYRAGVFDFGRGTGSDDDELEVRAPVRVQVWVSQRVSVYTELGVGAGFGSSTSPDGNVTTESRRWFVFGDPLGRAGASFHF